MTPSNRNACALVGDPQRQIHSAIELLASAPPYYAWRLLDRMERLGLGTSINAMLLKAKALHLCDRHAEAISVLEQALALFPRNPVVADLLFEILLVDSSLSAKLAYAVAWSALSAPTLTTARLLQALELLQRLQTAPIGVCRFNGESINGWLLNSDKLPPLTVAIDGTDYTLTPFQPVPLLRKLGLGRERDGFSLRVPSGKFQTIRIHLNGSDLAGSPIQLSAAKVEIASGDVRQPMTNKDRQVVDVVVPVYKGYQETRRCLESVLSAQNATPFSIIVIDDASPEPVLTRYLEQLAASNTITLLKQAVNSGFVESVKRGMQYNQDHDVILLNADTSVNGDWLDRLKHAAYSDPAIGTVTPLTNNGELVSYPVPMRSSAMPDAKWLKVIDDLSASWPDAVKDIPVGVGFCLYIKRDCLNAVGGFDSQLIERGYCEDTDFCIRVAEVGWRNVCATNVFVAHAGSVSFGAEKAGLVARNVARIYALYPEHSDQYDKFLTDDPLRPARDYLQRNLLASCAGGDAELLLMPDGTQGDYRVERLEKQLENTERNLFYLSFETKQRQTSIGLCSRNQAQPIQLKYSWPNDNELLWQDLAALKFKNIDIYDLGYFPLEVVQGIVDLKIPFRIYLQDYTAYCPQIRLTQPGKGYCGDPLDDNSCLACVQRYGSHLDFVSDPLAWRDALKSIFSLAADVILPSPDSLARFQARFVNVAFSNGFSSAASIASSKYLYAPLIQDEVIRIAVLQANHPDDGFSNVLELARIMAAKQINAELIVLGETWDDAALIGTGKAWVTGRVEYDEIPKVLLMHHCRLVIHLPCWPQTSPWPLTIARQGNLPFVTPKLGVFASLLDISKGDVLLDPEKRVAEWFGDIFNC